jgi:cytochrome c oxidase subunit 3
MPDTAYPPARRPAGPPAPGSPRVHRVPRGTAELGMSLFLVALGILFAASMLAYGLIRVIASRPVVNPLTQEAAPPAAPPLGAIDMPIGLWASTAIILLSSYTIHRALENVRLERQARFRKALLATVLLALAFLIVQAPSLGVLLADHLTPETGHKLYGAAIFLIIVHALHFVGGIIPLVFVTAQAHAHRYDHEHFGPVKLLTWYWHFLDIVWLTMFAILLILG